MVEFFKQLESPSWWLTVVFAGFLVNLAASYLKPLFDKVISKLSSKYRSQRKEAKDRYDKEIDKLSKNQHDQIMRILYTVSMRIHGLTILVLGLLTLFVLIDQVGSGSDCLESQAFLSKFGCQFWLFFIIVFMIHSNFLIAAVSATILHLPRSSTRFR